MKTKDEKGQTTVEYILLLVVIISIMSSVLKELEEYMVTGPNSMQNKFIKSFSSAVQGGNASFSGQYKYFVIRR